jgi:lipopolysaccharide export system permease protein
MPRPASIPCVKILHRYVLKAHAGPLLFAASALTSLMLLNYVAKQFANLVGKGLPWTVIAEFFLLAIPFTVAMTLPMAVLVATIYAFSQLAAEHEITAMKASGVRLHDVMRPVLAAGALVAVGMILFNDQVLPRANHRLRQLQTDIARKKPTFGLREQVINEVSPGQLFLKAGRIDPATNRMHEVVIYDLGDPAHRRTIYADSGDLAMSEDRRDLRLTLHRGYIQELSRSSRGELQRVFYATNDVRVRGIGNTLERSANDDYKGDREQSICELQRQVATSAREVRLARWQLERESVNLVRMLAAGRAGYEPDSAALGDGTPMSIGAAYCAVADRVAAWFTPADAHAAPRRGAVAQVADTTGVGVSTAGVSMADVSAPADSTAGIAVLGGAGGGDGSRLGQRAVPVVPLPSVDVLSSQAESYRIRLESLRQGQASYEVEIEKKFALSVACFVFVLFGAPIALRFPRGGVGMTIGVSLVVFSLYYVGLIAGESLADRGIVSPFLSMWGANLLFGTIGLWLQSGLGKEEETARGGDLKDRLDAWRDRRRARRLARGVRAGGPAGVPA